MTESNVGTSQAETELQNGVEVEVEVEDQAPKKRGVKGRGIGARVIELCRGNQMTNEEIAEQIREEFEGAKTSKTSVSWYRNRLRSEDEPVLTSRDILSQRKALEAEVEAEAEDGDEE